MRPVLPRDAELLKRGFARLSRSSVFQRFHGHRDSLSDETCRTLTTLDYRNHMALIALVPGRDEAVGVGRYHLGAGAVLSGLDQTGPAECAPDDTCPGLRKGASQ